VNKSILLNIKKLTYVKKIISIIFFEKVETITLLYRNYCKCFVHYVCFWVAWNFFEEYLRWAVKSDRKIKRNILHRSAVLQILVIVFYRYLPSPMAFHKKIEEPFCFI